MRRLVAILFLLTLSAFSVLRADDWPQFRGPNRTGVSAEKGLLPSWPKEGPKLLWKKSDAGLGFSSFAVVAGKLYTLGTDEKLADEVVLAYDAKTGDRLWSAKIGKLFEFAGNVWGDGPRSTPTVDGKLLYALGGQGDLVCIDITQKGKEVWRKNLLKDFDGVMMSEWGYSESPTVDGDLVIVTPGGEKGTFVALDKAPGAVKWRTTELTDNAPYSTGVIAEINGARQFIQNSSVAGNKGGTLSGVDVKTGKILWSQSTFKQSSYAIAPSPVVDGSKVYITTGYGGGSHLFDLSKSEKDKELFPKAAQKKIKNTHGGVVRVGGFIYGHTEPGAWFCQDLATGKDKWLERDDFQTQSGSVTSAEGLLYLLTDMGEVGLAKASPKAFELVSSFKLPDASKFPADRKSSKDSKVWAHPVIADGVLYLRDSELLFAYDIRKK
jgi:outer membrane protein assembly factor BamB